MKDKVNEIRISYKERIPSPFWQKINSSQDAAHLLFEHSDKRTIQVHESFKVVLLNNNNKVKGIELYTYDTNEPSLLYPSAISTELNQKLGFKTRKVKQANFQVLRETSQSCPALLFELGYFVQ